MAHVRIFCHADIQDLQGRSDRGILVELVSLESLRIASDSCALLVKLIEERKRHRPVKLTEVRYIHCREMEFLSLMAGVAVELQKIKHDLYPLLVSQDAKLDFGFLKNLVFLKSSAVKLVCLAKDAMKIIQGCEEDELIWRTLGKLKELGKEIEKTADLVLKGTQDISWLQARLPFQLDPVDRLLSTPVHLPE
ncbi:unnamed protein product [Urochloa decumbens]|uniref:Uncharacterized protein n=1 Tax=Urochloa decumbens TaxID=240449 RepID=A0ABC9GWN3_9POAL